MPLLGVRAFAAGVAVGWIGRSAAGSTREALVKVIVEGHRAAHDLRRTVGEHAEWIEDLMAEGRIRYQESEQSAPADDEAPGDVSGGRAA